jgi:hypothetical protein
MTEPQTRPTELETRYMNKVLSHLALQGETSKTEELFIMGLACSIDLTNWTDVDYDCSGRLFADYRICLKSLAPTLGISLGSVHDVGYRLSLVLRFFTMPSMTLAHGTLHELLMRVKELLSKNPSFSCRA